MEPAQQLGSDGFFSVSTAEDTIQVAPTATADGAASTDYMGSSVVNTFRRAKHPWAAFFSVFFKLCALLSYLLSGWFTDNFVLAFVVCTLFLAADFWTVKNVSGRLLVGLRWRNEIKEDGSSDWIYDSVPDRSIINETDSRIFWTGLVASPAIWALLSVLALLKFNFSWLMIVGVALTLNMANLHGYWKCDKEAKKRTGQVQPSISGVSVQDQVQNRVATSVVRSGINSMLGAL